MSIQIDKGPYGLEAIAVYPAVDYSYRLPLKVVYYPETVTRYATVRVRDRLGETVAFARCRGTQVEEAKQWLLNFTEVSL
jgi:hypothetical protein